MIKTYRSGQSILLVLLFLIPMVTALGLMLRTDNTVLMKIRLQNATDAAALATGAEITRVMNQIALHNMSILKYHALHAAMATAIQAAKLTLQKVNNELSAAQASQGCWSGAVAFYSACVPLIPLGACPEGIQAIPRLADSTVCVTCLGNQIKLWQNIKGFWTNELAWFQQEQQSFEREIQPMMTQLGQKSQSMVEKLNQQITTVLADISKQHRLDDLNQPNANFPWTYVVQNDLMTPGAFNPANVFVQVPLKTYTTIAMDAMEPKNPLGSPGNGQVKGIFHFEGPPPILGDEVSNVDGGRQAQTPATWGPTQYYMEYIMNVHCGVPGYFNYTVMHGPLGNPDSTKSNCGTHDHPGCQKEGPNYYIAASLHGCMDGHPCHRDWTDYSRDFFRQNALQALSTMNTDEFKGSDDIIFELQQNPNLEVLIGGRIRANQGYFNHLFPAHTIDQPDNAKPGPVSNAYLHALSKVELYNLTEMEGTILNRATYNDYPKSMLTQDWRTLMVPIISEGAAGVPETSNAPSIIRKSVLH